MLFDVQLRPEADQFDVEVLVDRRQFLAEADEVILAAHEAPQQAGQAADDHPRRFWLRSDQRRDRRQRVEEEVGVDLVGQDRHARFHQELLLLLQAMFDAGVVPDLDGRRDAQHREEDHDDQIKCRRRFEVEEALDAEAMSKGLTEQRQRNWRQQQDDLPIDFRVPQQPPEPSRQRREHERREVPDGFLRTQFAEAAAGEAAADGKRQGNEFTGDERGTRNGGPDNGAGVGSANQIRRGTVLRA